MIERFGVTLIFYPNLVHTFSPQNPNAPRQLYQAAPCLRSSTALSISMVFHELEMLLFISTNACSRSSVLLKSMVFHKILMLLVITAKALPRSTVLLLFVVFHQNLNAPRYLYLRLSKEHCALIVCGIPRNLILLVFSANACQRSTVPLLFMVFFMFLPKKFIIAPFLCLSFEIKILSELILSRV